jgi:Dolichyl-phosphate-mannose-protein mannosyltransferase
MYSRWDALLAALVFVVALAVNLHSVPTTQFHRDEARWVHRARFLEQAANPTGPYWRESELVIGQPPLGSYLMGLGLLLQGRDLQTNGYYDFHYGQDWNARHGNLPEPLDLEAARRTNSVVGALIAMAIYLIGRGLLNPVAGLAGAALLIPHALSIYLSSLAGSDAIVALLVAWSALAAMFLAQRPTWARAVVLGILLGLGGSAKLSPLGLLAPLGAAGLVLIWRGWRGADTTSQHDGALGWRLLALAPVATATFIASYPFLWPDPIARTLDLVRFRSLEMQNQGAIWGELRVNGPLDAVSRIYNWLGVVDSVTGQAIGTVTQPLGVTFRPMWLDLALAVIGGIILIWLAVRHGLGSRWTMALIVLGGEVALVIVAMRADFSRYLLPVLVANAVCGGLVVGALWQVVARRLTWKQPSMTSRPERTPLANEGVRV